MKHTIFLLALCWILSAMAPVLASETSKQDTVRFIVPSQEGAFATSTDGHGRGSTFVETSLKEIASSLKSLREHTCGAIGNGSFKVFLMADASGKVWGIGAGGHSGLEVTVNCGSNY